MREQEYIFITNRKAGDLNNEVEVGFYYRYHTEPPVFWEYDARLRYVDRLPKYLQIQLALLRMTDVGVHIPFVGVSGARAVCWTERHPRKTRIYVLEKWEPKLKALVMERIQREHLRS